MDSNMRVIDASGKDGMNLNFAPISTWELKDQPV